MTIQIAVRLDDDLVAFLDQERALTDALLAACDLQT
jgi:hypothetical protein